MSTVNVLILSAVVFVFMRVVCEPKLKPGREIWNRVLGLDPADAVLLTGVRCVGTISLLVGFGAGLGVVLTWWVESLNPAAMGNISGQEVINRVEGLLTLFTAGEQVLSRLGVLVSIAYFVLFAVGLLFWSARSTRDVRKRVKATVAELQELGLANRLPQIAPDERMRQVDKAIAAARAANAGGDIVEALFMRRFQYDVVRRVDPGLLREVGDRVPGSRVADIWRFLISMPLSHQVKRTGRIISALVMMTVVPASLVVASADLDDAMDKKRSELEVLAAALTLEVSLSQRTPREGRPDGSGEKNQPKTEEEADEKDREGRCEADGLVPPTEACIAAAKFGAAFEAAWGANLLDRSEARVWAETEGISDARRAWARRQVLLESAAPRMATVNVAEAASGMSERQAWPRKVMDAELKARTVSGPITKLGKLAEKIFVEMAQSVSGPVTVEVVDRPLTLRELASTAAAAGVGLSIDSVELGGTEPALEDKLLKMFGKSAVEVEEVRRSGDVERLRRAAELAAMGAASRVRDARRVVGESVRIDGDMMRIVEIFVDPDLTQSYKGVIDQVTRLKFSKLKGNPAPVSVSLEAVSSGNVDWGKVESTLRQYGKKTGNLLLDSLASYSSVFPGIEGQRAQTEEARVARILDAERAKVMYGGPPEVLSDVGREGRLKKIKATEMTPVARDRLRLARSFQRLRAYHRVGGVLVGREPDAAAKGLDLVGVDFTVDEAKDGLTIYLTHADGTKTTVGPYDPAVAHLALAYAADGRPTMVTIVPAPPLKDRKILLHPALIDTEVGCHAIRLDQFVSRFRQEGPLGDRLTAEIIRRQRAVQLYDLARKTRWSGLLDVMGWSAGARLSDDIKNELWKFDWWMQRILDLHRLIIPLQKKPSLFDPKLVEILEECLVGTREEAGVTHTQCIYERARQAGETFEGKPTRFWYEIPKIFNINNSGVREDAYELDDDMRFAQLPRDIWGGPLQFVLMAGSESANKAESREFEEIQELLNDAVLNAVRARPEALRTLRVMQQFTVAQRLFRAAFTGHLGERFPVENLVNIVKETATHVDFKAVKTDRWLIDRPSEEESLVELRGALGIPEVQQATCLGADH